MKADLLIRSDAIFDSVLDNPFKGYVAIKGNIIIGVGNLRDGNEFVGDSTRIIDCGKRLVIPGFHDSHTHLLLAGMYKGNVKTILRS